MQCSITGREATFSNTFVFVDECILNCSKNKSIFFENRLFPHTKKKKKDYFAYLLGTDNDETVHHLGEHGAAWQDGGYHDTLLKILGVQSCQYRFW